MITKTYTKNEKREYFKKLRENWNRAKQLLTEDKIKEIDAIIATHGMNISQTGFMFVSMQMADLELDGLPYLDAKTYQGWKDNGFQVRKGEKSKIKGVTWIGIKSENDEIENKDYVFPKEYHLFHRTQVESIK